MEHDLDIQKKSTPIQDFPNNKPKSIPPKDHDSICFDKMYNVVKTWIIIGLNELRYRNAMRMRHGWTKKGFRD